MDCKQIACLILFFTLDIKIESGVGFWSGEEEKKSDPHYSSRQTDL